MEKDDIVVSDYKRSPAKHKKRKFKHKRQQENQQYWFLFGVILIALAVVLGSILGLKVPVVPVCVILVMEALLAVCLHDVPIWLHGVVMLIQLIAGAVCSEVVFMLLCVIIYVTGILTLKYLKEDQ